MLDQFDADQQLKLLTAHRRTLSHYLHQQAIFSAGHTPPAIAHGIEDAREQIRLIKLQLRSQGIMVDDHPFDETHGYEPVNLATTPSIAATSRAIPSISRHHLSPEAQFWLWFEANSERLLNFKTRKEPILQELDEELAKVADGLVFEFSMEALPEREFIVSADGRSDRFSNVIRLVGAAPRLPGWKFIAFRQPKDTRFVVAIGKYKLAADDIWFRAQPHDDHLDVILYIKNLARRNEEFVKAAIFFALDSALGEYDVETKIGILDLQEAPKNPRQAGLKSFHELSRVVQNWIPPSLE